MRKLREKFVAENRITELYKREVATEDVIRKLVDENKINKQDRNFNKVYEEILAKKIDEDTKEDLAVKEQLTINPLSKKATIMKN